MQIVSEFLDTFSRVRFVEHYVVNMAYVYHSRFHPCSLVSLAQYPGGSKFEKCFAGKMLLSGADSECR